MIKTIVMIVLAIALVGIALCYIFDRIRMARDIAEIDEIVDQMNANLEAAQKNSYDILRQWSESMDKHEKAYNDLLKKNNELSLEIERKNMEIEKLNAILNYSKNDVAVKEDSTNGDETIPVQG